MLRIITAFLKLCEVTEIEDSRQWQLDRLPSYGYPNLEVQGD